MKKYKKHEISQITARLPCDSCEKSYAEICRHVKGTVEKSIAEAVEAENYKEREIGGIILLKEIDREEKEAADIAILEDADFKDKILIARHFNLVVGDEQGVHPWMKDGKCICCSAIDMLGDAEAIIEYHTHCYRWRDYAPKMRMEASKTDDTSAAQHGRAIEAREIKYYQVVYDPLSRQFGWYVLQEGKTIKTDLFTPLSKAPVEEV